jgi:hypothetical protein
MASALTPEQQVVKDIKDFIEAMPPEKQGIVAQKAAEIRNIIGKDPDGLGNLAVALIGAEIAAQP